jgi:hypothetical protein
MKALSLLAFDGFQAALRSLPETNGAAAWPN